MLRFLGVRHLAVIEHLEVEFTPGLNLLTGETGAGKSVLMEAVSLLVGGRASADLVRTGQDLAAVQAIFDLPTAEVVVRREVAAQGRSRAFIDDQLVTSAALRDWGRTVVDLHGQHEHQRLLDPASHLDVLDAYAGHEALVTRTGEAHAAWKAAVGRLDRARLGGREKQARIEIATFHLDEIDAVAPHPDEDARLEAERVVLANADRLTRLSNEAYAALYDGDDAVLAGLATVWRRVADLADLDARFRPYVEQRDIVKPMLEDLAHVLRSYAADLDASPDRLQAVEDRLAALERLMRKHGPTLADVLARRDALRAELDELGAGEDQLARLEADETRARQAFLDDATSLSQARRRAAAALGKALAHELSALAMPGCQVDLRVRQAPDAAQWTASGIDDVEFYLSPNPGEDLRPLARIASGGELSRVMLALHTLAATGTEGHTLVFDEVDAGIGGVAADAVGARLQALAQRYQVLCITHLPQIAARAGAHFHIAKKVRSGRTSSTLIRLDEAGREREIARMIAGADVTPQVLASARELLAGRGESKATAKGESAAGAKAKGRKRGT
ncbi:MAG: DNA repair protein RecN [Acidobacteria bacterium SCN 69-37]|nr:MAG: DNA repair protein RecN [Acidobacteria bacterium SCN 69-37]